MQRLIELYLQHRAFLLEGIKFGVTGVTSLFVQLGFLYILTEIFSVWYLLSAVIAHIISIVVNFLMQKFFVHQDNRMELLNRQLMLFCFLSASYVFVNATCMYLLVTLLELPYMSSQVVIVLILAIVTFVINRTYIFKKK